MDRSTEVHVLWLDCDEYWVRVATFENKDDADASAKIGNAGLAEEGWHSFHVESYPIEPEGTVLTLDQIKASVGEQSDEDEIWRVTDEEAVVVISEAMSPGQTELPLQ